VLPLVVGFPIYPTVVGTGDITPSTAAGIPAHSTPDGNQLLIVYLYVVCCHLSGSYPSICRYNIGHQR
jgi:hypothetical protein